MLALPDILAPGSTEFPGGGWERWRFGVVSRFRELCGEGAPSRPPLEFSVDGEYPEDGYTRYLVSYLVEENERCPAWLLVPEGAKSAPAVLCLHGTTPAAKDACVGIGYAKGGSAVDLARRGFVTLSPDHFCAGARLPEGVTPYTTAFFYEKHPRWSEMGKDIHDHRQALDLLCSLPECDAGRLACLGHSLGGYGALFLALMDERVAATVCSCGVTSWRVDPNRGNWSRTGPGRYKHFPKLKRFFEAGENPPLDFHEIMAAVAPRALLNCSAAGNDCCFPIFEPFAELYVQTERVYKALGAEGRFGCFFHSEEHSFNSPSRALAYAWLESQLGLETIR